MHMTHMHCRLDLHQAHSMPACAMSGAEWNVTAAVCSSRLAPARSMPACAMLGAEWAVRAFACGAGSQARQQGERALQGLAGQEQAGLRPDQGQQDLQLPRRCAAVLLYHFGILNERMIQDVSASFPWNFYRKQKTGLANILVLSCRTSGYFWKSLCIL